MSKMNSAISGAGAGFAAGGLPGAAIGAGAGLLMGGDDDSKSYLETMLKEAQGIPLPVLKEYYPELYQVVSQMNPELETAVNLGPSEMQGIATDPSLRQAQLNALKKLQGIGDAGGRDAQFLADQGRLEQDINANRQGQEGAIMQNLAARGMGGGGSELAARMMASQNASNTQAQMGMDAKAQAEKRALDAIMQSGQLGGQMQAQDFSQQSAKAQAADSIARFNAANQQQIIGNNVANKNNAQQFNANNANNVAAKNTAGSNQAQLHNNSLDQQRYENELRKRGMINSANVGLAENSARQAREQDQFAGGAIGAAGQYFANKKKEV